jgi:2-oxoglutarate ferredoxin oxidoreductase subunit gamma
VLEKVIIAGFGGQGILFLGKVLAQAMMREGRNVTFFPSYGPEVRGGRANCHVTISTGEIFSPAVTRADSVLAMSQLAWDYFAPRLRPGGLAVLNASMVAAPSASSARVLAVPATDIATDLGDVRAANMVLLGAYIRVRELLPVPALAEHLHAVLGSRKADLFELNRRAIEQGAEAAEEALARNP